MIPWLGDEAEPEGAADPFPETRRALPAGSDAPGLLAAGGRLTPKLLEAAYRRGIFPWYSPGQPVLWWSPDPRMVLQPEAFALSRSLRKTIARFRRTPACAIRIDTNFDAVIDACSRAPRQGQSGTWIVPELMQAYRAWHRLGQVHSVETWVDGRLVGGLYGVSIGRMFFGESMFALQTDASKIAMAALVCFCRARGIGLIDCQQRTGHLASLGASEVPRSVFEARLQALIACQPIVDWTYDPSTWAHLAQGLAAVCVSAPMAAAETEDV